MIFLFLLLQGVCACLSVCAFAYMYACVCVCVLLRRMVFDRILQARARSMSHAMMSANFTITLQQQRVQKKNRAHKLRFETRFAFLNDLLRVRLLARAAVTSTTTTSRTVAIFTNQWDEKINVSRARTHRRRRRRRRREENIFIHKNYHSAHCLRRRFYWHVWYLYLFLDFINTHERASSNLSFYIHYLYINAICIFTFWFLSMRRVVVVVVVHNNHAYLYGGVLVFFFCYHQCAYSILGLIHHKRKKNMRSKHFFVYIYEYKNLILYYRARSPHIKS